MAYNLKSLSFKFFKDLRFRCGDIPLFLNLVEIRTRITRFITSGFKPKIKQERLRLNKLGRYDWGTFSQVH